MAENGVQKAGDIVIEQLKLVSSTNIVFDLVDFLVELNIYEDMFSGCMHGNMVLSDSRNLIEKAPLIGEEFLLVKVTSPTFTESITKTFRIFKISDRNIVRDNNTQTYTIHFASIELFYDIMLPLFVSFEGDITDVVSNIFSNYLMTSRTFDISETSSEIKEIETVTPLYILNDTSNKVKFVSPGWSPLKCINWLASKSIPKNEIAKNFLFFESNKAFYFGSIEFLLKDVFENKNYIGDYTISAANIRDGAPTPNINREYFIAKDVSMVDTTDHIKNYTNGYLANRILTLDIFNKKYNAIDYDYVSEYKKQFHTSGPGDKAMPIFTTESLRNPATDISFYPINPKLFNNFEGNINEKMGEIYGNRKSSMLDLSNLKMHLTVPGRTDVEIGRVMYFNYPALGAKESVSEKGIDKNYSGYYLITAIHHKINKVQHLMTMEMVKDSLYVDVNS
jgi:hypothetical protein